MGVKGVLYVVWHGVGANVVLMKKESMYVCVTENARARVCVCVCVRERARASERKREREREEERAREK